MELKIENIYLTEHFDFQPVEVKPPPTWSYLELYALKCTFQALYPNQYHLPHAEFMGVLSYRQQIEYVLYNYFRRCRMN